MVSEHERLQRAAFARGATAADLDALARFEARSDREPGLVTTAEPARESTPDQPDDAAVLEQPATGSARRVSFRVLAGLATLALGVGLLGGWFAASAAHGSAESSLTVFARPKSPSDSSQILEAMRISSPGGNVVTKVRYLRTLDGLKIFGGLGTRTFDDGTVVPVVCISVEAQTTAGISCVQKIDFLTHGVTAGTSNEIDVVGHTYHWGPTGAPTKVY